MKTMIALLTLVGILAQAQNQGTPYLTAEFAGYNKKTKHSYVISQSKNGLWKVSDTAPCPSYPCTPADHTTSIEVKPKYLSDLRAADGNTEIELSKTQKLTFINNGMAPPKADGTREESYWKLTISKDGVVQDEVKLYFRPRLLAR